jgi:hypothetical protein
MRRVRIRLTPAGRSLAPALSALFLKRLRVLHRQDAARAVRELQLRLRRSRP